MGNVRPMLDRECAVIARYLGWDGDVQRMADVYARMVSVVGDIQISDFEERFTRFACSSVPAVTLCDAYARFRFPHGLLRRKVVAVLAALESEGVSHAQYDAPVSSPRVVAWGALVFLAARWAAVTAVSIVVLAPWDLASRMAGGRKREGDRG